MGPGVGRQCGIFRFMTSWWSSSHCVATVIGRDSVIICSVLLYEACVISFISFICGIDWAFWAHVAGQALSCLLCREMSASQVTSSPTAKFLLSQSGAILKTKLFCLLQHSTEVGWELFYSEAYSRRSHLKSPSYIHKFKGHFPWRIQCSLFTSL